MPDMITNRKINDTLFVVSGPYRPDWKSLILITMSNKVAQAGKRTLEEVWQDCVGGAYSEGNETNGRPLQFTKTNKIFFADYLMTLAPFLWNGAMTEYWNCKFYSQWHS